MGEEIGMIDPDFQSMADYGDIESKNAYQALLDKGYTAEAAFEIIQIKSRDNARTPMQWDTTENAGFSKGTPWLSVGITKRLMLNRIKTVKSFSFIKN